MSWFPKHFIASSHQNMLITGGTGVADLESFQNKTITEGFAGAIPVVGPKQ